MTQDQASNLITDIRQSGSSLIGALNQFRAAQSAYLGFDAPNVLTDDQFIGVNAGLTAADIHEAVATINTVLTGLNPKTIGDVYKIKL